jgi:hypothetical protein
MQVRAFRRDNIIRNVEKILRKRNIDFLTEETYSFIHLYCGSIAHFNQEGWKQTYRDLRDFLDFFLVRNEYGVCLVDPPKFMNLTEESRAIILGIVSVCIRYEKEVREELDKRELESSVKIGKKLVSGELSIRKLFASREELERELYSKT